MKIRKVHINNILSYDDETIELNDDLNIIVGSNGSGKSNLINIIIYIIKRYCFKNYEISNIYGEDRIGYPRYSIHQKNPLYSSSEDIFLQKHKKKENDDSFIDLTIMFEEQDILNLNEIKNKKEEICEFLDKNIDNVSMMDDRYQIDKNLVKEIFEVDENDLKIGEDLTLEIRETENGWQIKDNTEKYSLYMKFFSLICDIISMINIKNNIKNPFVFFEAYRNNSSETTKVGIGEFNNQSTINYQSWQNLSSLTSSIGINSTYIMLATKKFGKIMRNAIEKENGLSDFNNSDEYVRLKKYFEKFQYDINLKCISPENNIYQFYIIRDDLEIEIDTISSGEREIINFIFGLFLEELKDGIVIIDEPELHLHPNWQKRLIQILKSETEKMNVQIIFVTHSSSFISYNILNNIFRVYKENGYSKCIKISDLLDKDVQETFRKNLSVINATNNEKIFFSNYVVLVEGITDEILFEKIYEYEIGAIDDGLEFISISGKYNLENFTSVLDALKIKYAFIGDYDNLYDVDELKDLFDINTKSQKKDLGRKKNQSYACLDLIKSISELLANNNSKNFDNLRQNFSLYNEKILKEKDNLNEEEKDRIHKYIEKKYLENFYILKRGEIENYLNVGNNNKSLGFKKVISLINNDKEYKQFIETIGYEELKEIINKIGNDYKERGEVND